MDSVQKQREWTVLVYMNDNNNLCKGAQAMLKSQLAPLDPTDSLAIAVEYSHLREPNYTYPPSITHARAEVRVKKLETLERKPYQNMADPATLRDFLEWGIRKYPAKHYAVVIQSHGGAWRPSMPDEGTRIGDDPETSRPSTMSLPALRQTLQTVQAMTGVKPDVLAFDSCLMSNAEAAYELRDRAGIMIGSEDIISSTPSEYALDYAVPLGDVLRRLSLRLELGEQVAPAVLAQDWVKACEASWTTPTQTALDLTKIEPLKNAVNDLATALLAPEVPREVLKEVAAKARSFSEKANPDKWDRMYDYKIFLYDLQDLAANIAADLRLASAAPAAKKVMESLDAAKIAHEAQDDVHVVGRVSYGGAPMFERHEDYDDGRTHGLSIYLPDNPDVVKFEESMGNRYDELSFARDVRWGELVRKTSAPRDKPALE